MDYDAVRHRFLPMTESCFYILLSLQQPRHGYGILQHVRMLTQGRVLLGAGTLYQTLGKLEAAGLADFIATKKGVGYSIPGRDGV